MSKNNLPSVTSDIPKDLRYFIDRLRESLDRSGANRFATVGELKNAGVIDTAPDGGVAPPVGDDDPTTLIPVFTPPKPEGVVAAGGYEFITVTWNTPSYYGHQYAEVYRVNGDTVDFTNQQLVATVPGFASVFSDYVGTAQTFSYRVRFVNINDVEGPYSDPATASSALDVEELLEVLTGNITDSQLNNELAGSLFGEDGLAGQITEVKDDVNGLYVLKVAADGKVAGFGLSVEAGEAFFAVQADRFWLSPPPDYVSTNNPTSGQGSNGDVWYNTNSETYYLKEAGAWEVFESPFPFIVQTTPVTIDGVDVPPGVYINDGYIRNATITNAKIKDAAIDNAKIADATITSAKIGNLDAGKVTTGELKSHNFTNSIGTAGFLLQLGQREVFDSAGNPVTSQETVNFIIRAGNLDHPAMELKSDGTFEISGLTIRRFIQSLGYPNQGFKIDVNNNTFDFKDSDGRTIMTVGGLDSQAVRRSISQELDDLISDIGDAQSTADTATSAAATAQSTADTATSTAVTALDTANEAVDPEELGTALAEKLDTSEFETLEGQLRAFAFLDEVTPDNIGAFFADAAIGTAYIGNAAVGTAQIAQAAIDTALIRNAAITSAKIENLAVSTLKIGENAVTVPDGETGPCSLNVGTAWTSLHSPMYVQDWDANSVPQAVLVTAQAQFLGTLHGSTDGERRGSGFVRVRVEWRTDTGGWDIGGNQLPSESERFSSFPDGYSGLTTSVTHFNVPSWSRGARFTVQARFEPYGSGYETRKRGVSDYSITVLGAKR